MEFVRIIKAETIDVNQQKEADSLADLDRDPEDTHWHSARNLGPFQVIKQLDPEGGWAGLWRIKDKRGDPLPRELQGSFTDVGQAIIRIESRNKAIQQKDTN